LLSLNRYRSKSKRMKSAPDERLVRRAQRGDKAAFAELFTRYEGRIFGYLYRMVGNRAWAEDLAQEAFIQAHQHLSQLGPPYAFKAWMYRIAGNLALDGLRRYRHEVPLPDWDGGHVTAPQPADHRREGDPEQQARLAEVRAAVWRALHQLPDNYRQILVLREIDGLSYKEIAGVLGVSLDNVRITLHRARLQFRDSYGLQVMMDEGRLACQELDDLLSAYVDDELDRAGRKRVKDHIAACPACQEKQRDLLAVSRLLAVLVPIFPPATLHPRFLNRLREAPSPEGPPQPASGSGGRPPGGGRGPLNLFGRESDSWLLLGIGGGALILFIGVVALGLLTLSRLSSAASPAGAPIPSEVTESAPPPTPSATPTPTNTITPTSTSLAAPTDTPSATPAPASTPSPAPIVPTATPTAVPPTPTPTPTPSLAPYIEFRADATSVQASTCTTVYWRTEHVQAVFFNGQGTPGIGSHQTCPCANETHTLDVLLYDGSHDVRQLTIQVSGACATPTFTPAPQPPPTPSFTPTPTSPPPTPTPTYTPTPTFTPTPDTQPPPAPDPGYPVGGVVLTCRSTTTLSWKGVSDPSGVAGYYVQLEEEVQGKPRLVGEWGPLNGTQADVPVRCGLPYRWRVRAEDGAGNPGSWSEWAAFGVGIDQAQSV
jgi:RNA polymerase sigma-70 factor (ECF subfamily)